MEDWPQALKDYRRRHALTQGALAEILNVDATTVSRWERGRDQPALGIQRRLRSLVLPGVSDVERALRLLIDTSDAMAVLFDHNYRLLHSSPRHRALLRLDASELYGRPFEKIQSESQAAVLNKIGGPRGWHRNGVIRSETAVLRKAYERARNIHAFAQRGEAWTIRDGVETPFVLGVMREIPVEQYKPHSLFTTLDDALP